jgi:hypothetical protein
MACINCRKKKVKCVFSNNNNQCDRCVGSCAVSPTNPNRGEEQIWTWRRSLCQAVTAMPLTRNAAVHLTLTILAFLRCFSQGTQWLWSISDSTTLAYRSISSRVAMLKEGTTIELADMDRQVCYTFKSTTRYSEYIPLSVDLFHLSSTDHFGTSLR